MFVTVLVITGVILQFLGGLSYLRDTVKGIARPNKVSWLLWSIAPLIAFVAQIQQGVGVQSLSTFIVGFVPLLVFFASFVNKEAQWKIGRLDIVCGLLSIGGLTLWLITKVGNIAILFSIFADGLAALPTVIKSFKEPETETYLVFFFGIINSIFALITIPTINFEYVAFPLYLLVVNSIITIFIKFRVGKKFFRRD